MVLTILELLAGCALLLFGGDWLVNGGVALAKRFRVSTLVIGLTIVAFGTSAPELLVSLIASLKGSSGIALGNVIGSNIANIALILGLTAMICPVAAGSRSVYVNGGVMLLVSVLLMLFMMDGSISRLEGIIFVLGIILYVILSIRFGRTEDACATDGSCEDVMKPGKAILVVIASCAGLAIGADLLVDSASAIARQCGVSEKVIGLTVVALGTSLPELAASLIAAVKKQMDISIGNIIGSNIFNILGVIGVSASVSPIGLDMDFYRRDLYIMLVVAAMLMLFMLPARRWRGKTQEFGVIGRLAGLLMFAVYVVYISFLF